MEISLHGWLIIGGILIIALILFDGWRRIRANRDRISLKIDPTVVGNDTASEEDPLQVNPELPNGGARRRNAEGAPEPKATGKAGQERREPVFGQPARARLRLPRRLRAVLAPAAVPNNRWTRTACATWTPCLTMCRWTRPRGGADAQRAAVRLGRRTLWTGPSVRGSLTASRWMRWRPTTASWTSGRALPVPTLSPGMRLPLIPSGRSRCSRIESPEPKPAPTAFRRRRARNWTPRPWPPMVWGWIWTSRHHRPQSRPRRRPPGRRRSRTPPLPAERKRPAPEISTNPEEMLVIFVVGRDKAPLPGAAIRKIVEACGMEFSELGIYHRHEQPNGSGPLQFSMANAVAPGTFDLETIDSMETPAVSFFMSMRDPADPLYAFECMLATADTLCRHLDAELLDGDRSVMRPQTQEHYRERIRDFEIHKRVKRSP